MSHAKIARLIAGTLAGLAFSLSAQSSPELPAWAYPVNPPDAKAPVDDGVPRRVPGSDVTFSLTQLTNVRSFTNPDWHPEDHGPMPAIVKAGKPPNAFPCAYCHRADGSGGPESASINGLPAEYIAQQLRDYRSGARGTSVPNRGPTILMAMVGKSLTDEEIASAAAYFSAVPRKQHITVVESADVPVTRVSGWILVPDGAAREPIGQRVIEMPRDLTQFEHRDSRATFVAYVPPGSIARGEALARTGGGKTMQCIACHGAQLEGAGDIPRLAGRSPTYLARQLHDFQTGARSGTGAAPMKEATMKLTADDIVALVAYAASLKP